MEYTAQMSLTFDEGIFTCFFENFRTGIKLQVVSCRAIKIFVLRINDVG